MAIPRSGEIVRASILSEYNKIPIGKTFGTIAAERIVDITISIIYPYSSLATCSMMLYLESLIR